MNNPISEFLGCISFTLFGSVLHLTSPGDITVIQWAHELLQDGAWIAAIILGAKAALDFIKKRKEKK